MAPRILSRPLFPLVASLLLVGAAAATTTLTVTVGPGGATVDFESDDLPDLWPPLQDDPRERPPPRNDSFSMDVTPSSQTVAPSEDAIFLVALRATRDVVVRLAANGTPGFDPELGAKEVSLRAGENASVRLVVGTPANETRGKVLVNATASGTNETRFASVEIVVDAPSADLSLSFDPSWQNASAGESVTYVLHAGSTLDRTLRLNVTSLPPGYSATLERATLDVGPERHAWTNLTVHVPANATKGGEIRVVGWTQEGEKAEAAAYVVLRNATTQPPTNGTSGDGTATTSSAPPVAPPPAPALGAAPPVVLPAAPLRVRTVAVEADVHASLPMI